MKDIMIKVSEIEIVPLKPKDGLVAFVSCVINNSIYLGNIGLHTRLDGGCRLVFPAKKINGQLLFYHNPINKETTEIIEKSIEQKYKEMINQIDEISEANYDQQGLSTYRNHY